MYFQLAIMQNIYERVVLVPKGVLFPIVYLVNQCSVHQVTHTLYDCLEQYKSLIMVMATGSLHGCHAIKRSAK